MTTKDGGIVFHSERLEKLWSEERRDGRKRYKDDGTSRPAMTAAERQEHYVIRQRKPGRQRPGWWLDRDVFEALSQRRWKYSGWTLSDQINEALRELLKVAEVVDAKIVEIGGKREEALAQVLQKLAAITVEPAKREPLPPEMILPLIAASQKRKPPYRK